MPYPNEHAARVKEPSDFIEDSFRRKVIDTGITIIVGKLKSDGEDSALVTQAYRFSIDYFTADQARSWLKEHDINPISFEEATGEEQNSNNSTAINRDIISSNLNIENRFINNDGFEIRFTSDNDGNTQYFVSGAGIVYNSKTEIMDGFFESIAEGAFTRSLSKYNVIKSFINHNPSEILSTTRSEPALEILDSKECLFFRSPIPPTSYGKDLEINLKRKNIRGASFSFMVNEGGEAYTRDSKGNIHRVITDAEIYEVGPVTNPAYEQTEVNLRSKNQYENIRNEIIKRAEIESNKDLLDIKNFLNTRKRY